MHRSASWNRVADEDYFKHRVADQYYMHSSPNEGTQGMRMSSSMELNQLPAYDPMVEMAMKEKSRAKFAENAVHIIPFVLLLCGLVLWFFSNPDVNVGVRNMGSVAARIEGLTIEGDIDTASDGAQTGFLPLDRGVLDMPKHHKRSRKLVKNDLHFL
ncbi:TRANSMEMBRANE PROTEIN [Salix purpurea]|uniref:TRANSMEMBRANE PROTEIN n=1 Tax=Salix purpurea TaxID=77065 RepID=A0A9Q0TJI1_SALPP|nr:TRANSMEMBRANE PROTEIN [Salix purpurea]